MASSGVRGLGGGKGTATLGGRTVGVDLGAEEARGDRLGRQTGRGSEGRTRAESPRRLSLGWWSLLPFPWSDGQARLGTVPDRRSLDCQVQLLQVEAAGARNPAGAKSQGRG